MGDQFQASCLCNSIGDNSCAQSRAYMEIKGLVSGILIRIYGMGRYEEYFEVCALSDVFSVVKILLAAGAHRTTKQK